MTIFRFRAVAAAAVGNEKASVACVEADVEATAGKLKIIDAVRRARCPGE